MLVLIAIGFVAGLITSISPCILPVLPVVLAAGVRRQPIEDPASTPALATAAAPVTTPAPATGRASAPAKYVITAPSKKPAGSKRPERLPHVTSWRPYAVVAGLVISFSAATLFGAVVLSALHLSDNLLRDAGIVVLVIFGLGLVFRPVGELLELPFIRLTGRPVNQSSNGFVLGLGAGLLFVPCAGPVLATIAVVGATHRVGFSAVILTVAFGIGVAVPLLLLTLAGDALSRRTRALQRHAVTLRISGGVLMLGIAVAIGFNLTDGLQRHVPGYTTALQNAVEGNKTASKHLQQIQTGGAQNAASTCEEGGSTPQNCGPAPELTGINAWLNTAGDKPLTLAGLRGKVVLIDFWTYSCINCQRTLPHVEAWYRDYQKDGFEVIGVHTPEFAFEHVTSNIVSQARALGVKYPIAVDNDYGTWNAYGNQYWPAEYLIDATGVIRHVSFGEGDYDGTESVIRQLLTAADPAQPLPAATNVPDTTPTETQTPETYLGYEYAPLHVTGAQPAQDQDQVYKFPSTLATNAFALSGTWNDGEQALTAGANAKLELSYQADVVYLVIGGSGTVTVAVNGTTTSTIAVTGVPKLYTMVKGNGNLPGILTLSATPGVQAYDFTFG
ncbi:MAG TPA: cytochrome c biogenesis protein DipZ [Acidothermaceae bacterium]|jgi:cytochrome c biogenesis protein CcdA/thiol-disulfide isomerase/thioredoxin